MRYEVKGTTTIKWSVGIEASSDEEAMEKARWEWEGGSLSEEVEIDSLNIEDED